MNVKCVQKCAIFVAFFVLASGPSAQALFGGKVKSFTADQVYISPKGDVVQTYKIYVTPDKIRMDGIPGPEKGQSLGVIYHKDENRQCTFNPQKKLYFEGPLDEEKMKQDLKSYGDLSQDATVIGTEKVNGYKCTKKEVVTTVSFMGFTRKNKQTVWMSDKFDMPLKTRMKDGAVTELQNIDKGKPASKYFKTPEGYERVSSMMAVMGMNFSARDNKNVDDEYEDSTDKEAQDSGSLPSKILKRMKKIKLPFGHKE